MTLSLLLSSTLLTLLVTTPTVHGLAYDASEVDYNLNTNPDATDPLDYSATAKKNFTSSPPNWRFPFYTVFVDRYVNGDPTNDNANDTLFETDMSSTQLRNGGDIQGLIDSLDYIAGSGVKGIYLAGSPFINQPWGADQYSPLDLTLLDKHLASISVWQTAIDEIHKRGMYAILDNTVATLGDLIGFVGYLNTSAPFTTKEHKVIWKTSRQYLDFSFGNTYNDSCKYPTFWYETGYQVNSTVTSELHGCYSSDFDQYGDVEAFGVFPDWERQLAKFASVQDRLREWSDPVRAKLEHFSCMTIATLDIDGFRVDKAMQVTVDAQASFSSAMRKCAKSYGKDNFMVVGEITTGNDIGSIWLGRGRTPDMRPQDSTPQVTAMTLSNSWNDSSSSEYTQYWLREAGNSAVDAAAFHYSVYRFLARFLGLGGNLEAGYDLPIDWYDMWNSMLTSNDFYNANTGDFDPRHLYGVTNQDVFRWPALDQGTQRMLLGHFITTLFLPGIPLMYYGEEQNFYVLDNTADNYVYGRQSMAPSQAWMQHGCYALDTTVYEYWPVSKARTGCDDPSVALDHRDSTAPVRNIFKRMFQLRDAFPVFETGFSVTKLSNQTEYIMVNGSSVATEFGIWSGARDYYTTGSVQNETSNPIWLVYHNNNYTKTYTFDCSDESKAFIAPYKASTKVVNLFNESDSITLATSVVTDSGFTSGKAAGCLASVTMQPYEFRAYVPSSDWVDPIPMITKFVPGHDYQYDSTGGDGTIPIELHFNTEMSCTSIDNAISINSTIEGGTGTATIGTGTCVTYTPDPEETWAGYVSTAYKWSATISGLDEGVHRITLNNASAADGTALNSIDHFLIRYGQKNNPVVWPQYANYSETLLVMEGSSMTINHTAAGASSFRYSTNWGSSWTGWISYTGGTYNIPAELPWTGTAAQNWTGYHLMVQYWSQPLGSSAFIQHSDAQSAYQRRWPHVHMFGPFNQWGYDAGLTSAMNLVGNGIWTAHFMYEWPADYQMNIWGIDADNEPDETFIFGDLDDDGVLDRVPPSSLSSNVINITEVPPWPYLAYTMTFDDAKNRFYKAPVGNVYVQIMLFICCAILPPATAALATWLYIQSFYQVKINKRGFRKSVRGILPLPLANISNFNFHSLGRKEKTEGNMEMREVTPPRGGTPVPVIAGAGAENGKRTVLIASFEYNIDDWNIGIKIGGLGVMAKLMSNALSHINLIWVVPCVGGIDYPIDQPADPMFVQIMGESYEVQVQYHLTKNITYVLLDAPIFRNQTKANPYHSRMDDIESAILYAAWNRCIAETIRRFPVDIYHINDYHGAIAPLYLLPQTVPCCLSLHNAEFQGMWPMRTTEEREEVCSVFDLPPDVVKDYVQYGSVFNLLHAAASYLRIHQRGFGAVGVSKKYGDRSLARYPIFWALKNIGQLPNPDPSDTGEWNPEADADKGVDEVRVDEEFEAKRAGLRVKAQEWAGLEVDPTAELFVFVGRWSLQKGCDLIADIFPSILEKYPKTQLICVGPVIDLYGKFAALKLEKLVQKYPKRVFSRPEFTQLPPYIFSGAEFALIPSRDEPFGLVAVEFGRKGALGVGARVGGLGQMPGFWYTVESMTPSHLLQQFRGAIVAALDSKQSKRAMMRAFSAKQRFPVAQWVRQIDQLYGESIRIHQKEAGKGNKKRLTSASFLSRPSSSHSNKGPDTASMFPPPSPRLVPPSPGGGLDSPRGLTTPPPIASPGGRDSSATLDAPRFPWTNIESARNSVASSIGGLDRHASMVSVDSLAIRAQHDGNYQPSGTEIALSGLDLPLPQPSFYLQGNRNSSALSLPDVVGDRNDLKLQKTDLFFTDSNNEFYAEFEQMLDGLTAKNSHKELCIEEFLKKSEKEWFARYRDAKLGRQHRDASKSRMGSPHGSRPQSRSGTGSRDNSVVSRGRRRHRSLTPHSNLTYELESESPTVQDDEFLLGPGYKAPTGLKKFLSIRIGDWPIYAFLLALGQVISVNSYTVVLITGESTQTPTKLYVVASTYLLFSLVWWYVVRHFKSVYALSAPWILYGLAFFMLGVAPFISSWKPQSIVQICATAVYAAGASSGALCFALNFGDEGGAPTRQWIIRALAVTGVQQLYSIALWYWGSLVSASEAKLSTIGSSGIPSALVICVPIALLWWGVGVVLYLGLPDYYRQAPESIPGLYISLIHRKLVPWFFVMVIIQNYWLSAPYGRSWSFLFTTQYIPSWAILILAVGFFCGLWAIILFGFAKLSDRHTWLLPIVAVGLGAPRWAQLMWSTSNVGWYLPWMSGGVGSALMSRLLWLWLGLLDQIQGVGLGMMLLATLTRQHVMVVLIGAQVLGSVFTMLARATCPNALYATATFPDVTQSARTAAVDPWFWVCLIFQLIIPLGFFKFFRKEQVAKP